MRKQVRLLRHWKQRFNVNAEFVFRRRLTYGTHTYEPGDLIPQLLKDKPTKLRRFWESGTIELAEFEDPNVATGQVGKPMRGSLPEGVTVENTKGSWFLVKVDGDEIKVNGKKALDELLKKLGAPKEDSKDDEDWL